MSLFVNIYEVSRHYGGPEEGGWWYDVGRPMHSVAVRSREAGERMRAAYIDAGWVDRGHRYSVAPRGDDYVIRIEEHPGQGWPERRPRYE